MIFTKIKQFESYAKILKFLKKYDIKKPYISLTINTEGNYIKIDYFNEDKSYYNYGKIRFSENKSLQKIIKKLYENNLIKNL